MSDFKKYSFPSASIVARVDEKYERLFTIS